jgi:hypothetical protein
VSANQISAPGYCPGQVKGDIVEAKVSESQQRKTDTGSKMALNEIRCDIVKN